MTRHALLASLLALTACAAPEIATRQVLTLENWRSYLDTPGCVRPPAAGGNVQAAFNLAAEVNRTGRCVEFVDPAYSANVFIAALARDVRVADPGARIFHMHYSVDQDTGERSYATNIVLYNHAGLIWCLAVHNARFHDKPDGWTALSLNDIRRDCQ